MTIRITDKMLRTISGGSAPDASTVRKIRETIEAAGVEEPIELHAYEIEQVVAYRERERISRAQAESYLSLGPLPEHRCKLDPETKLVVADAACPFGCKRERPRVAVESTGDAR
jgi:hypothetical protein